MAGKPRNAADPIFSEYKKSKREFRQAQRHRIYKYEKVNLEKLANSERMDQRYFWYTVNKHKKGGNSPVQNDNGTMLIDPDQIRQEWNEYYKDLYKDTKESHFDDEFKHDIEHFISNVESMTCQEKLQGGPITQDDVKKEVMTMKNKKAPGWDLVTSKHIKYSSDVVKSVMAWLLNRIIYTESVPHHLKKGLIVHL